MLYEALTNAHAGENELDEVEKELQVDKVQPQQRSAHRKRVPQLAPQSTPLCASLFCLEVCRHTGGLPTAPSCCCRL